MIHLPTFANKRVRLMKQGQMLLFPDKPGLSHQVTSIQSKYGGAFRQKTVLLVEQSPLTAQQVLIVECLEPCRKPETPF